MPNPHDILHLRPLPGEPHLGWTFSAQQKEAASAQGQQKEAAAAQPPFAIAVLPAGAQGGIELPPDLTTKKNTSAAG
jgi:hypothetical protein